MDKSKDKLEKPEQPNDFKNVPIVTDVKLLRDKEREEQNKNMPMAEARIAQSNDKKYAMLFDRCIQETSIYNPEGWLLERTTSELLRPLEATPVGGLLGNPNRQTIETFQPYTRSGYTVEPVQLDNDQQNRNRSEQNRSYLGWRVTLSLGRNDTVAMAVRQNAPENNGQSR